MFLSGRADIAFFLPIEIAYQLKKRKSLQTVEKLDIGQGKLYYYLAFNIKTSDEIVLRFQRAFDSMQTDGTYETILNEYMN